MKEIRDIVTDEMLDAAQRAVPDAYRIDADRMIYAALQVMFSGDDVRCECPMTSDLDDMAGKLFKHYRNGKLYRYLFPVVNKDHPKEGLFVVYQDIESGKRYVRCWNQFFSSTKLDGKQVPRFEEQDNEQSLQ